MLISKPQITFHVLGFWSWLFIGNMYKELIHMEHPLDCILGCTYISGVADLAQLSLAVIANVVEEAILGIIKHFL